jgi:hypothetical protein
MSLPNAPRKLFFKNLTSLSTNTYHLQIYRTHTFPKPLHLTAFNRAFLLIQTG